MTYIKHFFLRAINFTTIYYTVRVLCTLYILSWSEYSEMTIIMEHTYIIENNKRQLLLFVCKFDAN